MVSRRSLLLGAAVVPLAGCAVVRRGGGAVGSEAPVGSECRTPDSLTSFATLGGAPLAYEISGTRQEFRADPRFIERLEAWAEDWVAVSGLGPLTRITTYGAFVDKCNSWHAAGRAFDFAVVEQRNSTISCRYDLYGDDPKKLPGYWRLSASLAKWFTYTLTYRYNEQHHNHIHIDNGISGYDATGFDAGSRAQVELVQGVARHVFGHDAPGTGTFDDTTRSAVRRSSAPLASPARWPSRRMARLPRRRRGPIAGRGPTPRACAPTRGRRRGRRGPAEASAWCAARRGGTSRGQHEAAAERLTGQRPLRSTATLLYASDSACFSTGPPR